MVRAAWRIVLCCCGWLLFVTPLTAQTWEEDILLRINAERDQANLREFARYGEIAQYREPLTYEPLLEASAQWWCDALQGSGWFAHSGRCNAQGYLIDPVTGKQLSRVWLPSDANGHTDWNNRNAYLGLIVNGSENGALLKRATPADVVDGWRRSGWADDPRLATKHYFNLVLPQWRALGVARQNWGGGKRSVFAEFAQ